MIHIVDYGAGNTRSLRAALTRIGRESLVTCDPEVLYDADVVILPGVGSARAAMDHLRESGADRALRDRFGAQRPMLGICLGMQLAMEWTEEDGGVDTLGLIPGTVRRIAQGPVPRLGWATVSHWDEAFYFAHSYAAESPAMIATSEGLCAAVMSTSLLGVQFHPEKSGPVGQRWLASCPTLA